MKNPDPQAYIHVRLGDRIVGYTLGSGLHQIGRSPERAITLGHPAVASNHLSLSVRADEVLLRQVDKLQQTLFRGRPLQVGAPERLEDGDSWQVGPFVLTYYDGRRFTRDARIPNLDRGQALAPVGAAAPPPLVLERPLCPWPIDPATPGRYLSDLPAIYQDEAGFLGRYLKLFEAIWEPLEQRQDHLALLFDPRTCPAPMLDWLAGWLAFPREPALPERQWRAVLAEAYPLLRWRGTAYGLTLLLELCTGSAPEVRIDPARPAVILIRLPAPADPAITPELVERLVEAHKPAHCGYQIEWLP